MRGVAAPVTQRCGARRSTMAGSWLPARREAPSGQPQPKPPCEGWCAPQTPARVGHIDSVRLIDEQLKGASQVMAKANSSGDDEPQRVACPKCGARSVCQYQIAGVRDPGDEAEVFEMELEWPVLITADGHLDYDISGAEDGLDIEYVDDEKTYYACTECGDSDLDELTLRQSA